MADVTTVEVASALPKRDPSIAEHHRRLAIRLVHAWRTDGSRQQGRLSETTR
jgi:hypothetical protein